MAVLVFLAGAAGAGIVATHLGVLALDGLLAAGRSFVGIGGQHLVVVGVVVLDVADRGFLLLHRLHVGLAADLHGQCHLGDFPGDGAQHALEQLEGFPLVFLLGVLGGVAAQVDALAQVVHGG